MTDSVHIGRCPVCGKLRFTSRKAARKYLHKSFPKEQMSVYSCEGYWHFGHTPHQIKRGVLDRREWRAS